MLKCINSFKSKHLNIHISIMQSNKIIIIMIIMTLIIQAIIIVIIIQTIIMTMIIMIVMIRMIRSFKERTAYVI